MLLKDAHSMQRPQITDEDKKRLLIWIREKELDSDSIRQGILCEKTERIYADLLMKTLNMSAQGESGFTFKASKGWF